VRATLTGADVPLGLRLKAALEVLRAATDGEVGPTDAGEAAVPPEAGWAAPPGRGAQQRLRRDPR
jgi:hypothetical protein